MDGERDDLTHDDIWDDSALVDSWNEALAEYKKYHSIHTTGGRLEDLPEHQNSDAKLETGGRQDAPTSVSAATHEQSSSKIGGNDNQNSMNVADGADPSASKAHIDGDDKVSVNGNGHTLDEEERETNSHGMKAGGGSAAGAVPLPQALLGSMRDDSLKRLLMSWYYAGYYTGLHEGQQKHQQQDQ